MKRKIIIACVSLLVSILVGTSLVRIFFPSKDYIILNKEMSLSLLVRDVDRYKGQVYLNDSIIIEGALKRINLSSLNNRYKTIYDINQKYQISKPSNNDTITIIKDSETLIYKLNKESEHWLKSLFKSQ